MHIYQEFLPSAHSMNESLQQRYAFLPNSNNKRRVTDDCLTRTQVFRSSRNYPLQWNYQVYHRILNTYLLESKLNCSNESCTFTSYVLMINIRLMHVSIAVLPLHLLRTYSADPRRSVDTLL
jgi:hypothetical protein